MLLKNGATGYKEERKQGQLDGFAEIVKGSFGSYKSGMGHCCAIRESGKMQGYNCGKTGKVMVEGNIYCGVHNPERLKGVSDKARAKHNAKQEISDKQAEYSKAKDQVIEVCHEWYKGMCNGRKLANAIKEMLKAEDKL